MQLIQRDPNKAYLGTWMAVPKSFVNVTAVKKALTFVLYSKYSIYPQTLELWRETKDHLWFPRAYWKIEDLPFHVVDCRPRTFPQTKVTSRIKLDHRRDSAGLSPTGRTLQQDSIDALLSAEGGVLQLACGSGKTCIALELCARLKVPAIIVVDNTHLIEQWGEEIARHLDVPDGVGLIKAGKMDWEKDIVLATYQTLASRADDLPFEVCSHFGVSIWDEGHHLAAHTFAKSADLFFGRRYILSATPQREDGLTVVYTFHVGKVLLKDLSQELKPDVYFRYTPFTINEADHSAPVRDKTGELHYRMVAIHLGRNRARLQALLADVNLALKNGRKVLVLSESRDEIINLWAMWSYGANAELYSDIPIPTPQEVGESLQPLLLTVSRTAIEGKLKRIEEKLQAKNVTESKKATLNLTKHLLERGLEQDRVARKIEKELKKRRKLFFQKYLKGDSIGGLMVFDVPPKKRAWFLAHKSVTFAIAKYGREGLDCRELDTILITIPFSSKNSMQQLMGRVLRVLHGKRSPTLMIYEDAVGMFHGMCTKLRKLLRAWPPDEGGPFDYHVIGPTQGSVQGGRQCQIQDALSCTSS
jgi:superfamily II DNA or RNA helicase